MRSMVYVATGLLVIGQSLISVLEAGTDGIIFTQKARFRIPFQYDANDMPPNGAKEVRLYLSVDQGSSWKQIKTVQPSAGKFSFEAAVDGEYWFAVRTIDSNGQVYPAQNSMEAGLKVIVDRMSPVLNLNVTPDGPGNVKLTWSAQDSNLDPSTLKLEYYQSGVSNWQNVSVYSQANGETSWSVPEGGTVAVRGTILDQAKNIFRQQAKTNVVALNSGQSVPTLPVNSGKSKPDLGDYSQPIASHTPVKRPAKRNPMLIAPGPRTNITSVPPSFSQIPLLSMPNTGNQESNQTNNLPEKTNGNFVSGPEKTAPEITQPRYEPITVENPAPKMTNNNQPIGKINRSVKSRQFKIAYRVDDVGPSGVSSVILYITQNQGVKWYRYGEDTDKVSPFHVTVPHDGIYGFTLRVRSGAGLSHDPPQPGDKAEIVVNVDQSVPVAKFLPAYQGRENTTNKILVRWQASDNQLTEKPVSISYSENQDGPWINVSGWVANSGQYVWEIEETVPARIYLKMTVRDEAGNEAVVKTPNSVVVDMSKPTARIVDVQPDNTTH